MKIICGKVTLIFMFIAIFAFPGTSAEQKQKIKFFRPSEAGNVLTCSIESEAKSVTTMMTNDDKKSEKVLCNRIAISGIMTIKTVTEYGRPATIEFKVDKVKGDLSGKEVKFASEGKTLEVNLDTKPCEFNIKGEDTKISREEILLLSLVFRKTRKENMSDFIGTENEVAIGDTWKAPLSPLQGEFEKRGVKPGELKMEGDIKLSDRKVLEGYDCWIIDSDLKAMSSDEFLFQFKAQVALPVDGKTGAIRITREALEKFSKKMADKNNSVMPDVKELDLEITDKMNVMMVPAAKKEDNSK